MNKYILLLLLVLTGCKRCGPEQEIKACELKGEVWECSAPIVQGGYLPKPTATKVMCYQSGGFSWSCQSPYNLPDHNGEKYLFE